MAKRLVSNYLKRMVFCAIFGLSVTGPVVADTIVLQNGNQLVGRITRETDQDLFIAVSGAEIKISRSNIAEMNRGFASQFFLDEAEKVERQASALLKEKNYDEAGSLLENLILRFEDAINSAPEDSDTSEVEAALVDLHLFRSRAVPPDPQSQEAEQLYQQALIDMDRIQYRDAFDKLAKAAILDPKRSDVLVLKADTAVRIGQLQEAIDGYRRVLEIDAEVYYSRVSTTYLDLLKSEGSRLINNRQPDEAVEIFKEILLIQGGEKNGPVGTEDFLARRVTREETSEEVVLMEVYRYADGNDLVDLAFAAVTKIQKIDSDNPEVAQLLKETGFLRDVKAALDAGDTTTAALLLSENEDLASDSRLADRVKRYSGDELEALEAQRLLDQAEKSFAARDYRKAAEYAENILLNFADFTVAERATVILKESKDEEEIKVLYDQALAMVEKGELDDAEGILEEIYTFPKLSESVQATEIQTLRDRIPRERRADELWLLAKASLDSEEFDQALEQLDDLASNFGETVSGNRASEWLRNYRQRLLRESRRYKPTDIDYIANWTDPNFWRAITPDAPERSVNAAPVPAAARKSANDAFHQLMEQDKSNRPEGRSPLMWLLLPGLIGAAIVLSIIFKLAPKGRGQLHLKEVKQKDDNGDSTPDNRCRACGQIQLEGDLACSHCGVALALSEDEEIRELDEKRRGDYDPWKQKVKAQHLNDFDKYFEKAVELAETSDAQAAIEQCRKALNEDPHKKNGYELLAGLYERTNQPDQAAICYREILLLDPTDALIRQKLDSVSAAPPLHMGRIPMFLAAMSWWLIYFLVIGADPTMWHVRLGLALLGFVATWQLIERVQKKKHFFISERHRDMDIQRPLPEEILSWKEQSRQAKFLAEIIEEHTGFPVPRLGVWRLWLTILLSILLLLSMAQIAWLGGSPIIFIGWPAGAALFFYLLEVHPRALTAHVVLRHLMEETLTPWADPHLHFEPKGEASKPTGEFLIQSMSEWPIKWALKPRPYTQDRQGVLNSLMQVLNRHWVFHRFYKDVRVVRDLSIPLPAGTRTAWGLLLIATIGSLSIAGMLAYEQNRNLSTYDERMQIGYQYLLDGDVMSAKDYFFEAMLHDRERVAPHLYAAHAFAAAGMVIPAERSFHSAISRPQTIPQAHNDFANFLQREGKLRRALEQYREALESEPQNADILSNAGSAAYKLKDYKQAKLFLERAVAVDPNHSRAFTTLGLVLEQLGDRENARVAYENAVKVAPEFAYTNVARERLELDLVAEDTEPLHLEVTTQNRDEEQSDRPS